VKKSSKTLSKESFFSDDIISSIAQKNIKNFLHYKRWKKSTINDENTIKTAKENQDKDGKIRFFKQKSLQINKIHTNSCEKIVLKSEKPPNLKHIYKKIINNKHILTHSLSDLQQIIHKNTFSKTFSGDFYKNNENGENRKEKSKEKFKEINGFSKKKVEKKSKEMNKLVQIVTKVKNFKLNFSEKNMEPINKLLESVKNLNKYSENKKLQIKNSYSPQKKKFILDSTKITNKNPIFKGNSGKNQRKSFDSAKVLIKEAEKTEIINNKFIYYMSLLDYFIRNPNDSDYFNLLYREHFLQSLAAYNYCIGLKKTDEKLIEEKKVYLGENPRSI